MSAILHQALMAGYGAVQGSISFVAASGAEFVASGTTINTPSTPAGIQNGDGLYAIYYARSAITPPSGWTLVVSQTVTGGGVTQDIYIYRKNTVTSADSSSAFTWTQASSGRSGLAYIVVRSSNGTITTAQTSSTSTSYSTNTAYPQNVTVPTLTATTNGEMFLIASSGIFAGDPALNLWTAPSGATVRTTTPVDSGRMFAATQARNSGQSNSSPATFGTASFPSGTNFYATVCVRLRCN